MSYLEGELKKSSQEFRSGKRFILVTLHICWYRENNDKLDVKWIQPQITLQTAVLLHLALEIQNCNSKFH